MDNVHEVCHLNKPSSQTFRIQYLQCLGYYKGKKVKQTRNTPKKAQGVRSIAPTHSRLGTGWGVLSASLPGRALPPGKGPPLPIVQETGWAPEPV
jgi:hypothetical protein